VVELAFCAALRDALAPATRVESALFAAAYDFQSVADPKEDKLFVPLSPLVKGVATDRIA
jgi:hypothetical protein